MSIAEQLKKLAKVRESLYSQNGWCSDNVDQNSKWDVGDMQSERIKNIVDSANDTGTNLWSSRPNGVQQPPTPLLPPQYGMEQRWSPTIPATPSTTPTIDWQQGGAIPKMPRPQQYHRHSSSSPPNVHAPIGHPPANDPFFGRSHSHPMQRTSPPNLSQPPPSLFSQPPPPLPVHPRPRPPMSMMSQPPPQMPPMVSQPPASLVAQAPPSMMSQPPPQMPPQMPPYGLGAMNGAQSAGSDIQGSLFMRFQNMSLGPGFDSQPFQPAYDPNAANYHSYFNNDMSLSVNAFPLPADPAMGPNMMAPMPTHNQAPFIERPFRSANPYGDYGYLG